MSIGIPKPRPRALEKQDRAKRKQSVEDRENARVKARSKGQCEVREQFTSRGFAEPTISSTRRCVRRASETHHLLGGSGRRGVGESAKAENKLHVCSGPNSCHDWITRRVLQVHWLDVNDRAGSHYAIRLK